MKAIRKTTTPRKPAPKKPTSKKTAPKHSEIITECVRYAQSIAAYGAGFEADTSDDSEIAAAGGPLGKVALANAEMALVKLINATESGAVVLSASEMKAMAAACDILMRVDARGSALTETQRDFVEGFALSAITYFKHAEESAEAHKEAVQHMAGKAAA
jgi:hypothetical protein